MTIALTQASIERAALVTEEAMGRLGVLVQGAEGVFVSETPTGLSFDIETPLEVWARLTVRLIVQHKRLEWALADAINFGQDAYGDLYAQWVQETGLNKRTLQNYARIGRLVGDARRRADVSFSHHAEVISLPVPDQERLLDRAESQGMTRYDLRDAVRERRRQLEGQAVTAEGAVIETPDLPWHATIDDLTDEARASLTSYAPQGRFRTAWIAGYMRALQWAGNRDCFKPDRWRD